MMCLLLVRGFHGPRGMRHLDMALAICAVLASYVACSDKVMPWVNVKMGQTTAITISSFSFDIPNHALVR